MRGLLEPEQLIGRWWHRWAGSAASYPCWPEAGVALAENRARLAVFFRALGGPGGICLAAATSGRSSHRLTLRQRLGLGREEPMERPTLNGEVLALPRHIDCLPTRELNRELYVWLIAYFAHAGNCLPSPADPLRSDLLELRAAHAATQNALRRWPGLRAGHAALAAAVRRIRPRRALDGWELAVEQVIHHLLGAGPPAGERATGLLRLVVDPHPEVRLPVAPRGYRPYLPVPLWGTVVTRGSSPERTGDQERGGQSEPGDGRRHASRRRTSDQTQRKDTLLLNRFEYLLSVAEMVNVNREVEDDDPDSARLAAETLEEISITDHARATSSRLRLDLDDSPPALGEAPSLRGERTYPEWDHGRGQYRPDHCRVVAEAAGEHGEDWKPDAAARRRIRAVKHQFEVLRHRRRVLPAQRDGDDLDLAALIRYRADIRSGRVGCERVYCQTRNAERDLTVALLVDASLSTDSWIENRRVLDVEKEAVLALVHGLDACGDDHGVFAFTSRARKWVNVLTLKAFDEPLSERVHRRVQALKPGYYTRIGAAVRHAAAQLAARPNRHRLLLILSDGKPNDMDHYEGRYGIEDTRRAIREVRSAGIAAFGITIDKQARDYFPYLFGPGAYAIVQRLEKLSTTLPAIYRQLAH